MSSSDEDAFPVEREAAMEAIGKMIDSEGLEKLTSSKIRAHLSSVFNKDFDDFRKEVDQLTKETIERREKSKAAPASDNGNKEEKPLKAAASDSGSDTSDEGVVDDSRRVSPKKKATKRKPRKKDKNAPKKDNSGKFGRMTKLCLLSEDLQSIVGARFMKRCDVVSKMWEYIRAHDLLDPKDKRFFFVDDKLRTVFGCKRFRAFW
ncbi:SWIB/MDM2 domain protein [Ancylostoma ceylanicum]|uniref:SWIB/MDM2 domain protein n=1 Tax=Ancylostoma ceylanicum TaxID=53326 RepID=A0A0D6L6M9_9BILA|nr:SWIB/MDM2 domain protein [Ancylostoma ceylanicum]